MQQDILENKAKRDPLKEWWYKYRGHRLTKEILLELAAIRGYEPETANNLNDKDPVPQWFIDAENECKEKYGP